MDTELEKRIALLASDRESGASEILDEAIEILRAALKAGNAPAAARGLCRAQPSMASIWNAALTSLAAVEDPELLEQFAQRVSRGPAAVARFARDVFEGTGPLRVVTVSFSRSVEGVLRALAEQRPLRVACSEGRPAFEGRRLATRLAGAGIPVTYFSDAAIGHALASADAVMTGADAVAPEWFLNKCGTRMLAAAAAQQGIPLYLVATRDKFASRALAAALQMREGEASDIWDGAPSGVAVRNPYFESTPIDLVTSVISDLGLLGPGSVPDVCDATARDFPPDFLESTKLNR